MTPSRASRTAQAAFAWTKDSLGHNTVTLGQPVQRIVSLALEDNAKNTEKRTPFETPTQAYG